MTANGSHTPDVLVIGGGVVGAAAAYYLARAGASVTLVEAKGIASAASGANAGMLYLQTRAGWSLESARASDRLFQDLRRQLPIDFEYRRCGGMIIGHAEEHLPILLGYVRRQQEMGHAIRLIDAAEVHAREPALGPEVVGAAFSEDDGQVNPILLTQALILGALQAGAAVLTETAVVGIKVEGGRLARVLTTQGAFCPRWVVNAAGAHAAAIAQMAGIALPLKPRRIQMAVTEALPCRIHTILQCARRITRSPALYREAFIRAFPDRPPPTAGGADSYANMGYLFVCRQNASGTVIVGESVDFAVLRPEIDPQGLRTFLGHAAALVPTLRDASVLRIWNGTVADPPDGLPLIGESRAVAGLVTAAGHNGSGILHGPVTGRLVADLIGQTSPVVPLEPVQPDRSAPAPAERV